MSKVIAIMAMDESGGIGFQNSLPWPKNKKDMEWFRDVTIGHSVLMGRKTWESLGCKKLTGRHNIVASVNTKVCGAQELVSDLPEYLYGFAEEYKQPDIPDLFIIGGANIYEQALPFCDEVYLTTFNGFYECDTYVDLKFLEDFTVSVKVHEDSEIKIEILKRSA